MVVAALVASIIIAFGRDKTSSAVNFASNLVARDKISIPENPSWQNELGVVGENSEQTPTEGSTTTKETTTDVISRTLIANYLALKQSGKLDNASAQKLINQTVNYIDQTSAKTVVTTQSDLNVVADNGKKSITDYGENLGNTVKNKKISDVGNELNILVQMINSGDQSRIKELDNIIANYEKIIAALVKMPVPKTFIKVHLDIVNGINGLMLALKEAKNISDDPLKGLSILQMYQKSAVTLSIAVNATIVFIKQNNVVYEQGSGGHYLLYGI